MQTTETKPQNKKTLANFFKRGKQKTIRTSAAGFTFVEVMIVVCIVAVLSSLAYPTINGAIARAQTTTQESLKNSISMAKSLHFTTLAYNGNPAQEDTVPTLQAIAPYLEVKGTKFTGGETDAVITAALFARVGMNTTTHSISVGAYNKACSFPAAP